MSWFPNVLRPNRFLSSPLVIRVFKEIPADKVPFAFEFFANDILDRLDEDTREFTLECSLENPVGALGAEATAAANFLSAGRQAFVIADPVVEALSRTSPGDVRVADIQLPFSALYVAFETPVFGAKGNYPCEGAYLWRWPGEGMFVRLALLEDKIGLAADFPHPGITLPLADEQTLADIIDGFRHQLGKLTKDYAADPFKHMAPDWQKHGDMRSKVRITKPTSQRIQEYLDSDGDDFGKHLATVLSCACLLTSAPEDMVRANVIWPRPVQTRPGTSHKTERGALPVRYVSFGTAAAGGVGSGDGVSPRAHWRRGHWRRTPYGPVTDRAYRPKWIRPTLVNPDHGPVAEASVYRVAK